MKELKMYVVSWWSFKTQKAMVKSFRYRKSAVKFAVKLTDNNDAIGRVFTEFSGINETAKIVYDTKLRIWVAQG